MEMCKKYRLAFANRYFHGYILGKRWLKAISSTGLRCEATISNANPWDPPEAAKEMRSIFLAFNNVSCLHSASTFGQIITNSLSFFEGLKTFSLDS